MATADIKISQLPLVTEPDPASYFPLVDVGSGGTVRVRLSSLLTVLGLATDVETSAAIAQAVTPVSNRVENLIQAAGLIPVTAPTQEIEGATIRWTSTIPASVGVTVSEGSTILMRVPASNNISGDVRLSVSGGAFMPIVRPNGTLLKAGDLKGDTFVSLRLMTSAWRVVGLLQAEVMEALADRVAYLPGAESPSGATLPEPLEFVITTHIASNSWKGWRLSGAPGDNLESDLYKKDLKGRWWRYVESRATQDLTKALRDAGVLPLVNIQGQNVITAELSVTMKTADVTIGPRTLLEIVPVATSTGPISLNIDGAGPMDVLDADGGPVRVGALVAGRSYLLRRAGSAWRIVSGGVTPVEMQAEVDARQSLDASVAANFDKLFQDHVGDEEIVFVDRNGLVGAQWLEGRLAAEFTTNQHRHVGDTAYNLLTDQNGKSLAYVEDHGEIMVPGMIPAPEHVGDPIIILGDSAKRPLLWWDEESASVVGSIAGGGGSTISRPIPSTNGNAWQVLEDGTSIRYLSDQYEGRVIGFEERAGLTLAETGQIAVGMLAFGGNMSAARVVPEMWQFHNRRPDLSFDGGMLAAEGAAVAAQMLSRSRRSANPTVVHVTRAIGSPVEVDTEVGSAAYNGLLADLAAAAAPLTAWGKTLVVDRLMLSLLGGAPTTSEIAADTEYAAIAQELRADIVLTTGQAQPVQNVVVSQSIGSRTDGRSTVALAEATLDVLHPTMNFVVATPRHPFPLVDGTASLLTPEGAAMVSELEALAVVERGKGLAWFCPRLVSATRSNLTITARFVAMSDLVLGQTHGFNFDGDTAGAVITGVTVSGQVVTITVDKAPSDGAQLCVAWGRSGDPGDGRAANRTTIRDQWSAASLMVPGQTLYRYALSMRVGITTA